MKTQIQKPMQESHVIQGKTRANRQAPIEQILQRYKDKTLQLESLEDEDELLQGKFETAQREEIDEKLLQGKFNNTTQLEEFDEDELLQGKFADVAQREPIPSGSEANKTGLPDNLKTGIENLSGYSMDDVRVHYNSSKPAQLQALAYAQGTDMHVAPGQEKHLPHEVWHVVQQMQGRVQPTMQLQGVNINDNEGLEKEADEMGERILQEKTDEVFQFIKSKDKNYKVIQMLTDRFFYDAQISGFIQQYNLNPNFQTLSAILNIYRGFNIIKKGFHYAIMNEIRQLIPNQMADIGPALGYYNQPMFNGLGDPIQINSHTQAVFRNTINNDIGNLAVRSPTACRLFELLNARRVLPVPLLVQILPTQIQGNAIMGQTTPNASANALGVAGNGEGVDIGIDSTTNFFAETPRNIVLIHELIHALHATYGVKLTNNDIIQPPQNAANFIAANQAFYNGAMPDDIATVGDMPGGPNVLPLLQNFYTAAGHGALNLHTITENSIRGEVGLALRAQY